MILIVTTCSIKPDKIAAYEAASKAFVARVRRENAGVVYYEIAKSRTEPNTYRVVEVYKDEAAQSAHLQSKALAEDGPAIYGFMASDPAFVLHDSIS